ncbi:hypothetical protein GOP47_0030942 [Adiantum capillus-veneris]|nr:hypothetical protein GOP47_0030942 [Adiantum capillus-veneris]
MRIKAVIEQMPTIYHALMDGVATAHSTGIVQSDLYPFNIMLKFARTNKPRVGIIHGDMMLRTLAKRETINYLYPSAQSNSTVLDAQRARNVEMAKRPWIAPKLYDPRCTDAYTKASNIYALGYLFDMLANFWSAARKVYFPKEVFHHLDEDVMRATRIKVDCWMKLKEWEQRRNASYVLLFFKENLKTDPNLVQHPLVELAPSFYPI